MGVERRNHESRTRHRDDHVDIARLQTGFLQARRRDALPEHHGMLLVLAAGLFERSRFDDLLDRQNGVVVSDPRVVDHSDHRVGAPAVETEHAPDVVFHVVACQRIRWNGGCRRRDGRV